jgi:hypothetical protein
MFVTMRRLYSVKYVIWTERYGSGPNSAYREIRSFSCEGGTDKFMQSIQLLFRPWDDKLILGRQEENFTLIFLLNKGSSQKTKTVF